MGEGTVYINGTFDLFHVGHLNVLERARRLGNRLVVGVLTDDYVLAQKGRSPVIPHEQRARIVAGLRCVDAVVPEGAVQDVASNMAAAGATIRAVSPQWADGGTDQLKIRQRREQETGGVAYVVLRRTPGVSSSEIKRRIREVV